MSPAAPRHPDKDVNAAIAELRGAGWRIVRTKGRTHAWAKVFCPNEGQGEHWDCATSISGTPRNGVAEARRLKQRIKRCRRLSEAT